MEKEITGIFADTLKKFREAAAVFTDIKINKVPFEGSWTGMPGSRKIFIG